MTPPRRRQKLIRGSFQLQLVLAFLCVSAIALLLQFLMLGATLLWAAQGLEGAGGDLLMEVPAMLVKVFAVSLVVLLPLCFLVGLELTHRVAGPLYRFERFLSDVISGTESGPCRIRSGDRLHELCDLINLASEPMRRENARRLDAADEPGGDATEEREPARLAG